jgi:hypothetical protein
VLLWEPCGQARADSPDEVGISFPGLGRALVFIKRGAIEVRHAATTLHTVRPFRILDKISALRIA